MVHLSINCLILTVRDVEQLRSAKTTLNKTVVQMMDELEEAELPAQRAIGHSELLQQRVGTGDVDGGRGGDSGGY